MTQDTCIREAFFKYVVRIKLTKKKEIAEKYFKGQCKLANNILYRSQEMENFSNT